MIFVGVAFTDSIDWARSICLWTTLKKKPVFTQALAHGFNEAESESEGTIKTARWITALGSLRYSDLFASGQGKSPFLSFMN